MAKLRKNIIIQGLSGSLGDQLVIKQDKAGRTIISASPTFNENRTFSEAQLERQERFREASSYAKDAKMDDVYVKKAEGTAMSSYNVAMADWFHAPEIHEIDIENWHGQAGEIIRIRAMDDVKVTLVKVVITDENGNVVEQGEAQQAEGAWWTYTATAAAPENARIVVSARDLPGHITQMEIGN